MAPFRPRSGRTLLLSTAILAAAALLPLRPGTAAAAGGAEDSARDDPPTVAIIPFGAKAPKDAERLALACEAALARIHGLKILPPARWNKEATDSGEGADLEAMAKRLGADVLVTGTLAATGEELNLQIDVLSEQGLPLSSFSIPLLSVELGPAANFLLADGLARAIRPAVGLPEAPTYPQVAAAPEPSPQGDDKERPIEELLRRQREAAPKPLPPREPWRAVIEAELDALLVARTLTCGPGSVQRRNLPCEQAPYPLDIGAGGRLAVTLFPLALRRSLPAALTGIGLRATLEAPYWPDRLSTAGTEYPTRQLRAEGGLWWRMAFGRGATKPALELGVLYGYHRFTLSGGERPAPYPDAIYQGVIPTLTIGAFIGERVYLRAGGAYLAMLSEGPLTDPAGQNPLGRGSSFGFRGGAAMDVRLYRRLLLSLGVTAEQIRITTDGQGCVKPDASQPACSMASVIIPSVKEAADLHLSAYLGLGFRL